MDERIIHLRVGAVVVVAVFLAAALILFFREGNVWTSKDTLYMYFDRAPNVTEDTPIRKNGILIGRVTKVELLADGGVRVTGSIDRQYRLRKHEVPSIASGSLFGDAVIEFTPDPEEPKSDEFYPDGANIADGRVASDPLSVLVNLEPRLVAAVDSITGAGTEMTNAAGSFNNLIANNEARLNRIIQKTESTLDEFQVSLTSINRIVGDEELNQNLRRSLERLPTVLNEVEQTFVEGREAIAGFRRVSESAEKNLRNLEDLTRPLGERGEQLAADIERSVHNIDLLLAQLVDFSKALNNRDGTLGKLVYDRELYDRLNRTIGNVEEVSRQFQPIVNDVRILSDKLARDPRQLGLKGALDSRPLGIGTKANPRFVDTWAEPEPAFDLDEIYPSTAH
jgi:phospholipid/cholesterol/gamma-HCH transport system substrate-binding protein